MKTTTEGTIVKVIRIPMMAAQIMSLLDGTKDITRRPIRGTLHYLGSGRPTRSSNWNDPRAWGRVDETGECWTLACDDEDHVIPHRYGAPGDVAAITEAFKPIIETSTGNPGVRYHADESTRFGFAPEDEEYLHRLLAKGPRGWQPSGFMPAFAARITREIHSVRPQRLHEIAADDWTESEVRREGIGWDGAKVPGALRYFVGSWNAIYGEGFAYEDDPWIRRIQFLPAKGASS